MGGILKGKSGRRAALDAGYAPSSADHATTDIMPAVERAFAPAVRKAIPLDNIIQRLREGLDAQVVKVASFEGRITDEAAYIDFAERRAYAELIVKLGGYYVPTERIETPSIQLSSDELIQKILGRAQTDHEKGAP